MQITKSGQRTGKTHNDPVSSGQSRTQRRSGTKSTTRRAVQAATRSTARRGR